MDIVKVGNGVINLNLVPEKICNKKDSKGSIKVMEYVESTILAPLIIENNGLPEVYTRMEFRRRA